MKRLERQAILYFLLPLVVIASAGLFYIVTGRLQRALAGQHDLTDWLTWALIGGAAIAPPIWGYRLTRRLSAALAQSAETVRRALSGDYVRTALDGGFSDAAELTDLEQGINATAVRMQERLVELAEGKARLEAVMANLTEGVLLMDATKRVVLANPAAEIMLGTTRAEVIGRDILELTHHFDLDQKLDAVLRTGQPGMLEIKRARPDQQVLEAHLAPVGERVFTDREGLAVRAVLLVLRDVTRSRRLEQMRTEFVSNVTHELRTPLTAIRGFAETLADGALEDPEAAAHFVGIIRKEANHLHQLIEDLLDLSRIESGKWTVRKEPVDLGTLLDETVGRMRVRAQDQGVRLEVAVPDALPSVPADPARLAQVLINLVDNALKYTPAGGSVTVTARDAGPAVSVSVADTGSGIPKADLPRIFERFYRVDKARTRATGGTGLGLSIVKHIVDAHGGTINVVSDSGQGAMFTFTLPKA